MGKKELIELNYLYFPFPDDEILHDINLTKNEIIDLEKEIKGIQADIKLRLELVIQMQGILDHRKSFK